MRQSVCENFNLNIICRKDTCPICKKEQEKNSRQVAVCRRDAEKGETLEASDVGEMRPVTWDEMDRVQTECSRLLDIFAEYIANVADADRSPQPLTYLDEVTKAVSGLSLIRRLFVGSDFSLLLQVH